MQIINPKTGQTLSYNYDKNKYHSPDVGDTIKIDENFYIIIGTQEYLRDKTVDFQYVSRKDDIYQGIKVDFKGRVLYIDNEEVYLTPKEFDLLTYFIKNPNTAITRDQLLNKVWGYDYFGDDRTIDSHIKILRNNLGKYRDLIITIRGVGYKFIYEK